MIVPGVAFGRIVVDVLSDLAEYRTPLLEKASSRYPVGRRGFLDMDLAYEELFVDTGFLPYHVIVELPACVVGVSYPSPGRVRRVFGGSVY